MEVIKNSIIKDDIIVYQPGKGFKFSADSIYLAWFVKFVKKAKLIEVGAGSGVISALLAKMRGFDNIDAVELQTNMYDCLIKTIDESKLNSSIRPHFSDIKDFKPEKHYDVIVSNPPYKKIGSGRLPDNDIDLNARFTNSMNVFDVFKFSDSWLKNGGSLYVSYDAEQVSDLFEAGVKYNLEAKRMMLFYSDLKKKPKIVLAEFRKNSGRELIFEPPFFQKINGKTTVEEESIMNGEWN